MHKVACTVALSSEYKMPKRRRESSVDEEGASSKEAALAAALFGSGGEPTFRVQSDDESDSEHHTHQRRSEEKESAQSDDEGEEQEQDSLFVVDTSKDEAAAAELCSDDEGESSSDDEEEIKSDKKGDAMQPVWEDEDDLNIDIDMTAVNRMRKLRKTEDEKVLTGKEYAERLREFHNNLRGETALKWARIDQSDNLDASDEAKTSKSLVKSGALPGEGLPAGKLRVTRRKPATDSRSKTTQRARISGGATCTGPGLRTVSRTTTLTL